MAEEKNNYYPSNDSLKVEQSDIYLEVLMTIRNVISKWWIVAICAVALAVIGLTYARIIYVPSYTSRASMAISTKNSENTPGAYYYQTTTDFMTAEYLASTYGYIITSRDVLQTVEDKTGYKSTQYTVATNLITKTNIMEMSVTSQDYRISYDVAKTIIDIIEPVAEKAVLTGSLSVLEQPTYAFNYEKNLPLPNPNTNSKLFTIIGFLIGFGISFAILFLMYYFKNTVKTASSLQSSANLNLIGTVHHVIKPVKKQALKKTPLLLTNKRLDSTFIETYRAIRTKIENVSAKKGYKTFMIASSLENEGKTTVAVNIAIALAQNNKKVLFVDADLRKPAVHLICDVDMEKNKNRRIIDVLEGRIKIEDAIIHQDDMNLDLLVSSSPRRNSSELLSNSQFKEILEKMKEKYDYIIVDTPPAKLVADAMVLSNMVDATVMVVRQDVAKVKEVVSAIEDLSQGSSEIIGFIFNNVDYGGILPSTRYYYHKKGYYYSSRGHRGYYGYYGYYGYGGSHRSKEEADEKENKSK